MEDRKHLPALLTPNWAVRLWPSKERGGQEEAGFWGHRPEAKFMGRASGERRPQSRLWLQRQQQAGAVGGEVVSLGGQCSGLCWCPLHRAG